MAGIVPKSKREDCSSLCRQPFVSCGTNYSLIRSGDLLRQHSGRFVVGAGLEPVALTVRLPLRHPTICRLSGCQAPSSGANPLRVKYSTTLLQKDSTLTLSAVSGCPGNLLNPSQFSHNISHTFSCNTVCRIL